MTIPTIRAFAEVLPRRVDPVNRTNLDQNAEGAGSNGSRRTVTGLSQCWQMSAMGQKRTLFTVPFYVCFAPESGHLSAWGI